MTGSGLRLCWPDEQKEGVSVRGWGKRSFGVRGVTTEGCRALFWHDENVLKLGCGKWLHSPVNIV